MTRREVLARYGRDVLRLEWGDVTSRISMLEAESREAIDAGLIMARVRPAVDRAKEALAARMQEIAKAASARDLLGLDGQIIVKRSSSGG